LLFLKDSTKIIINVKEKSKNCYQSKIKMYIKIIQISIFIIKFIIGYSQVVCNSNIINEITMAEEIQEIKINKYTDDIQII